MGALSSLIKLHQVDPFHGAGVDVARCEFLWAVEAEVVDASLSRLLRREAREAGAESWGRLRRCGRCRWERLMGHVGERNGGANRKGTRGALGVVFVIDL